MEIGPQISPLMALQAIESIVADDFCADAEMELAFHPEKMSEFERESTRKLMAIYEIAHSNNPGHECYQVHCDWRRRTEERINAFAKGERLMSDVARNANPQALDLGELSVGVLPFDLAPSVSHVTQELSTEFVNTSTEKCLRLDSRWDSITQLQKINCRTAVLTV